jgi:UDP-N-acetylglucosamine/UDP-N-acetylgalactosamine diphosphorylase
LKKYFGRNSREARLINKYILYGQGHIFRFWNELSDKEKDDLMSDISRIDLRKIARYFRKFRAHEKKEFSILPTGYLSINDRKKNNELRTIGENALRSNEVAFLTVAGGQGSRLGYDHPKGFFPVSPVKKKSLFRIFAEKILFYSGYYGLNLYWYIMTSEFNYNETIDFFKTNGYFGLNKNNIIFFKQDLFPTLSMKGKLILRDKESLYLNPDGHGGILKALLKIGLLDQMIDKGIKHLSYFQVDNPLVNMADPEFIGYHIKESSQVSSKVIAKLYPEERLGAICKTDGTNRIIEYSDLSKENMYETDKNGVLRYLMGSIAIHIFDIYFLKHFTKKIPVHFAVKKIQGYEPRKTEDPQIKEMEAVKFETFVFDSIPLATKSVFYETDRDSEFYPLKNKEGVDSIETCVAGQNRMFYSWLKKAGLVKKDYKAQNIEISPLYSPDMEIFLEKVKKDSDKLNSAVLDKNGETKNEIYID